MPSALRLVTGSHPERLNTAEPVPAPGGIECPVALAEDAMEIWDRLAPELVRQGTLTRNDVDEFALFCDAQSRWNWARKMLDEQGDVVDEPIVNKDGEIVGSRLKRNPWSLVWRQSAEIMMRTGARFGLSPSDRSQLKVSHGGEASSNDDYFTS